MPNHVCNYSIRNIYIYIYILIIKTSECFKFHEWILWIPLIHRLLHNLANSLLAFMKLSHFRWKYLRICQQHKILKACTLCIMWLHKNKLCLLMWLVIGTTFITKVHKCIPIFRDFQIHSLFSYYMDSIIVHLYAFLLIRKCKWNAL